MVNVVIVTPAELQQTNMLFMALRVALRHWNTQLAISLKVQYVEF